MRGGLWRRCQQLVIFLAALDGPGVIALKGRLSGHVTESRATGVHENPIRAKLAEIMGRNSDDALFEPFFRPKAISDEIKRRQTVTEQSKWSLYYAKWGCLICETKETSHFALGMCRKCRLRTVWRLRKIVKEAQDEQEARGAPVIRDLVEEAQNAIGIKQARRELRSGRS